MNSSSNTRQAPLMAGVSDSAATQVIIGLSTAIVAFLFWLIYFAPTVEGAAGWAEQLPLVNAILNGTSATLVILGLYFIKRGSKVPHITCMIGATAASSFFLIGYLIYHALFGDTRFTATGIVRPVYFFILISHIILSVAVVPLILGTLFFSATRRFHRHKQWARWTYPVWIYVSVTGVLVYLFLRVWFPGEAV